MRRTVAVLAALVLPLGALSACGDEERAPRASDEDPAIIEVTFSGDDVDPSGDRVKVGLNQVVRFVVTADAPGQMHAHTKPDNQAFNYDKGTTTFELQVDKPGLVDVESHELDKVIVQLQVE